MAKIVNPDYNRIKIEIDPYTRNPELSEEILQALTRLLGWDNDNSFWRPLETDNDGRLRVNVGGVTAVAANSSNPTIAATSTTALAANPNRNSCTIFNNSSVTVFLNFGETATTTDGLPLLPSAYLTDDSFRGRINGIVAAGTAELRVVEFE